MLRMMQKMDAFDFDRELLLARRELYPLALKFTENKEDAEDLLQETMIKALCNRNKFDTNANFKGRNPYFLNLQWRMIMMRRK